MKTTYYYRIKSFTAISFYRNVHSLIYALFAVLLLAGCSDDDESGRYFKPSLPDNNICILYDNDVHGALDGYVKMAALKSECIEQTQYVTTVSNGDFSMGSAEAGMTKGTAAYHIMDKLGYDIVTLGNHEFDYGVDYLLNVIRDSLHTSIISSNLCRLPSGELLFPACGKIHAKTGTVNSVSTLSGYAQSSNDHILVFSIMNQGIERSSIGRNFQDAVCNVLCK